MDPATLLAWVIVGWSVFVVLALLVGGQEITEEGTYKIAQAVVGFSTLALSIVVLV